MKIIFVVLLMAISSDSLGYVLPQRHFDPISYLDFIKKNPYKNTTIAEVDVWREARLWSLNDKKKACDTYKKLFIIEKNQIFKGLALTKLIHICKLNSKESNFYLNALGENISNVKNEKWLKNSLLERLLESSAKPTQKQLLWLEKFVELADSRKTRIKIYKTLWENGRAEALSRLVILAPRFNPKPKDWFIVGADAQINFDFQRAYNAYKKALKQKNLHPYKKRQILDSLRVVAKSLQKKPEALNLAKTVFASDIKNFKQKSTNENASFLLQSGLVYAKAVWTENQAKKALEILKQIEKILEKEVVDVGFVRSQIHFESGQNEVGVQFLDSVLVQTQEPKLRTQYLWIKAWALYKIKNYEKSLEALKELGKLELDNGKKSQVLFWQAKILSSLNKKSQAQDIYEDLIEYDPFGYYTWLSYRELGKSIPITKDKELPPYAHWDQKEIFETLLAIDEPHGAKSLLNEYLKLPEVGEKNWIELYSLYNAVGSYAQLFGQIAKSDAKYRRELIEKYPQLLFPRPYGNFIFDSSAETGLWPEYIWALARQESSFDPRVISGANAYGVMQILPSAARKTAKEIKEKFTDDEDLLEPQLNLQLGAWHLRDYWDVFNGQFILTTAAYNAGVDATRQWVKTRYQNDPLEFIEDIPYEETRNYVKLVMRNFINYLRYTAQSETIQFPEWCLEGISL